jgi:hypothetical protein
MRLYHATPVRNFASINRRGLLTAKSKGRLLVVWLHSASKREWATLHTMKRHGTREVAIFECTVPSSWLTRSKPGLWYCDRDVPPGRIKQTIAALEE